MDDRLDLRLLPSALLLLVMGACADVPPNGPPARLVAGTADTVVVNHARPTQIPVRVLDATGRALPPVGLRYEWTAGDSVAISATGEVSCAASADARLRVSVGGISTNATLRCRPVHGLRIPGPMEFILGEPASDVAPNGAEMLPVLAVDRAGRQVDALAGKAIISDSTIATLDGLRVRPLAPGSTLAEVRAGGLQARVGVHVYQRLLSLETLQPAQHMVAVPLRLGPGELRRWPLPAGGWMLTMLPYEDEARGPQLRVEGANCMRSGLTPRRFSCLARSPASVVVYRPVGAAGDSVMTGELLVRRTGHR